MPRECVFKGPLRVHGWQVTCAACRYGIEEGEMVWLVEDDDPRDDVYVHLECAKDYLEKEDV